MIQLRVTRPGSLFSVILDREITEDQLAAVREIVGEELPPSVPCLDPFGCRRGCDEDYCFLREQANAPAGAGDQVEAFRG